MCHTAVLKSIGLYTQQLKINCSVNLYPILHDNLFVAGNCYVRVFVCVSMICISILALYFYMAKPIN